MTPSLSSSSSRVRILLVLLSLLSPFHVSCLNVEAPIKDVGLSNPVVHITPSPLEGYQSTGGSKNIVLCERVRATGISRWQLKSYANSFKFTLTPSVAIPEKLHSKIAVCFHRNASLGLCECAEWEIIQYSPWVSNKSPYGVRYMDVKLTSGASGALTVSVEEDFQQWRLYCLTFGFGLLLIAPIVSNWVPFYYGSSMTIGVLAVLVILLFQGMKLVPTGRRSFFYLTIYGSALGIGSIVMNYFTMMVNSVLLQFGLGDDMHNLVFIMIAVGVVLAGAALGFWSVRRFVISEDGSVDKAIALFVKWAMRSVAVTSIFQSTLDIPLAMAASTFSWCICFLLTSFKWRWIRSIYGSKPAGGGLWLQMARQKSATPKRTEFLSRLPKTSSGKASRSRARQNNNSSPFCTNGTSEYPSIIHKTPNRRRFSRREYEAFTEESTKQAMAELAASPEFSDWIIENAPRIQLLPDENYDSIGNESESDEEVVENGNGHGLFSWYPD